VFESFIPKFEYLLIDSKDYSVEELMKYEDMVSLFLILDKIKRAEQISIFGKLPKEYLDIVDENSSENMKEKVRRAVYSFLARAGVPEKERDDIAEKIKSRRFSEMFTLIDGYNVQETRRIAREEGKEEAKEDFAKDMLIEGDSIDKIIRLAKLPLEKVLKVKEQLQKEGKIM
jgi:hypothetical protein